MLAELPTYEGSLPREGVRTSGDKTTQDSEGSSTATLSPAELTTVKGVEHLAKFEVWAAESALNASIIEGSSQIRFTQ
uniref:Uncharacterized protein n=1 Tax=Lotus japonicus TaxID=34305 RepID=I3S4Q0_LOTJA|nr:unknown [Lotus japonicus]